MRSSALNNMNQTGYTQVWLATITKTTSASGNLLPSINTKLKQEYTELTEMIT